MSWPHIPKSIRGTAGRIRIIQPKEVLIGEQKCYGLWDESERAIHVCSELRPYSKWVTFFHEATHAALADAGVDEMMSSELREAVCDAMATARLHESFRV